MKPIIQKVCSIEKVLFKTIDTDFITFYPTPIYVLKYINDEYKEVEIEFKNLKNLTNFLDKEVFFLTSKICTKDDF